ncbi:MAG: hypothetical protein Q7J47_03390 [Azoarcus sp.]|nr:hypothetical protein [Azoarcus sp.]
MLDTTLQFAGLIAAVVIYARAEPVLSRADGGAFTLVGAAAYLLTAGSIWGGVSILLGYVPSVGAALLSVGLALLLLCGRRLEDIHIRHIPPLSRKEHEQ